MAHPTPDLVAALRQAAQRLAGGAKYSWSLMGSCNCGHLAQVITSMSSVDIQRRALQNAGNWTEQALEFCPSSHLPMEDVFYEMMQIGLTREDIGHLEHVSDPAVLDRIPEAEQPLKRNDRDDVVRYMNAWADLLEAELLPDLPVPQPAAPAGDGGTLELEVA